MKPDRTVRPGDFVVCTYRLPSITQPWLHPFWIGIVEEASADPTAWNGSNSEKEYCLTARKARVRYFDVNGAEEGSVEHDRLDSLHVITAEEAALAQAAAIEHFLGSIAATNWRRAMGGES